MLFALAGGGVIGASGQNRGRIKHHDVEKTVGEGAVTQGLQGGAIKPAQCFSLRRQPQMAFSTGDKNQGELGRLGGPNIGECWGVTEQKAFFRTRHGGHLRADAQV